MEQAGLVNGQMNDAMVNVLKDLVVEQTTQHLQAEEDRLDNMMQKLDNMDFDMVMDMLLSAPRPLRLVLRRDNFEGWTKAEDLPPPPLPTRKKDKAASSSDGGGGDQPPEVPPKVPPKKKKKKKSKKVNEGRAPAALPSPTATPG